MPKVLMVNTVASGSHGRIMLDVREAAQEVGMEVMIAYGRGEAPSGRSIRIGTQRDVLAHVAQTRLFDRHALASRRATEACLGQIDRFAPDLVHIHNVHGYYLHAPTFFAYLKARALPVLWTHHDCWAMTGHCSHFVRAHCDRWQTGCHDCPLKRAYPAAWGLDASRSNWVWKRALFSDMPTLRLAAPSRWLALVMEASFLSALPRTVIGNGVDLSRFRPAQDSKALRARYAPTDKAMLLAVASPFDARKGYADVLAVAERLRGDAIIYLVGLSKDQMQGLPPNVRGMPRTGGPEALVSLYQAADCFLSPTHEDTYPTVTMEALACGTPVAGYAVGGQTEQLDGGMGAPVPVGETALLADAAMTLAEKKADITRACRAHAAEHFDRRNALRAYLNQYAEMLSSC